MPWCDGCSRYYTPPSVRTDGTCPHCGTQLAPIGRPLDDGREAAPVPKPPWHFWVLVAAAGGYLGWRLVQGVAWVVERL